MHALAVGFSMLLMAILLALLAACSHSTYRDGEIEISRWSFGTDYARGGIREVWRRWFAELQTGGREQRAV